MPKGKGLFLFLIILITSIDAVGQDRFSIKGVVRDSSGLLLENATVAFMTAKDTFYTISQENGSFIFNRLSDRKFNLLVTMNGYLPYHKEFSIPAGISTFRPPPFTLQVMFTTLEKINVVAAKPITFKEDTVEYNARAFHVKEGAELEELLKRLPGIRIDFDGNVYIQGRPMQNLLVDGRPFFGGNILLALRNLPAEIIDKIQAIDDYGDRAKLTGVKLGDPGKVLNIVLKPDKKFGRFGHALADLGTGKKYAVAGDAFSFKGAELSAMGATFNNNNASIENTGTNNGQIISPGSTVNKSAHLTYSDSVGARSTGSESVSIDDKHNAFETASSQETWFANGKNEAASNNSSINNNTNLQSRYVFQYSNGPNANLHLEPFIGSMRGHSTSTGTNSYLQQDSTWNKTDSGNSASQMDSRLSQGGMNLNFLKTYPRSRRRVHVAAGFKYAENQQNVDLLNNTLTTTDNASVFSHLHYLRNNSQYHSDLSGTVNYFEPLGAKTFIELSYSYQQTISRENQIVSSPDSINNIPVIIDSLSNTFTTTSVSHTLRAGYTRVIGKLNINLGLNLLSNTLKNQYPAKGLFTSYSMLNATPILQMMYVLSRFQKINIDYNGISSAPAPNQLQAVPNVSNPQYPIVGNPDLKTSFTHRVGVTYELNVFSTMNKYARLSVGINYSETQNSIVANLIHPRDNSVVIQKTTYLNASGFHSEGANLSADLPGIFHNTLVISVRSTINENHSLSMVDSVPYGTDHLVFGQQLSLRYTLPDRVEINVEPQYNVSTLHYSSGNGISGNSSGFIVKIKGRAYFWQYWKIGGVFTQSFVSGINTSLKSFPALLNADIEREFLKGRRALVRFSVVDMFNSNTGISQAITANSVTRTRTNLTGRYFQLTFQLKFSHFGK